MQSQNVSETALLRFRDEEYRSLSGTEFAPCDISSALLCCRTMRSASSALLRSSSTPQ